MFVVFEDDLIYENFKDDFIDSFSKKFVIDIKMLKDFENGWQVKEGPKYIKIIRQNAVHAFIVKKDFTFALRGKSSLSYSMILKAT